MAKRYYNFMIDDELLQGLRTLKKSTGLAESEQIRRGVTMWLESNGIRSKRRRQLNVSVYIPEDPEDREALLVTDREASTFYGAEDLEVILNIARTYLEQWSKDGAYSWVIRPASGGGFAIILARGPWHFVIGPLDADISTINQAKEEMGATDERMEVDGRMRAVGRKPKRMN